MEEKENNIRKELNLEKDAKLEHMFSFVSKLQNLRMKKLFGKGRKSKTISKSHSLRVFYE